MERKSSCKRALDLRTRTTSRTGFALKFFHVFSNNRHPRKLHCTFDSPEKLALIALSKEFKTSPGHKMIKLLTFNNLSGAPNDNFRKNICSEDDFRSRIFGTFVVKFLACLPLL